MQNVAIAERSGPLIELAVVATTLLMLAALAREVLAALLADDLLWWIPCVLLLALASADFATGMVHWLADSFFSEETPGLGPALIRPFREHHADPQAMVGHGQLELHANSCIPVLAVLALAWVLPFGARDAPLVHAWLLCFLAISAGTNQLHAWAHAPSAPRVVRWLQRRGVILSPERHARHHRGEFRQGYCMTTGWLNSPLDRIAFFPRLEAGIRALGTPRA